MIYLKLLEKQEQVKFKNSRWKEIIKSDQKSTKWILKEPVKEGISYLKR
jgi:hypothetical protein